MDRFLDAIQPEGLFRGIEPKSLPALLTCLQARARKYRKGEPILLAGQPPEFIGIVLSGRVQIAKEDHNGNRTLVASLEEGAMFGETLCCANVAESPVCVTAESDCTVVLIDFQRILGICPNTCAFHTQLIQNMLLILAQKNLYLQTRMDIISCHSIRERVLKYFAPFARAQGAAFTIPLNREQLAQYLCVDRSALSHALMRLKQEGVIDYHKNTFQFRTAI